MRAACSRAIRNAKRHYDVDPVERAKAFVAAGAQQLHVIDLDGAFGSGENNEAIARICRAVDVPGADRRRHPNARARARTPGRRRGVRDSGHGAGQRTNGTRATSSRCSAIRCSPGSMRAAMRSPCAAGRRAHRWIAMRSCRRDAMGHRPRRLYRDRTRRNRRGLRSRRTARGQQTLQTFA